MERGDDACELLPQIQRSILSGSSVVRRDTEDVTLSEIGENPGLPINCNMPGSTLR